MEKLEPPLQKDNPNPNPNLAQWLNYIRLSQNTINLILSLRSQNIRVLKARCIVLFGRVCVMCRMITLHLLDKAGVDCVQFSCL